ncbi:MAG: hypothetical protein IIA88_05370, partial [Bacteroidetes bacterium]|nr:hypothetical protein [Bacteroidota bacterium]
MRKVLLNIFLSFFCLNAFAQISYNLEINQFVVRDTLYIDFLVTRTGDTFNFGNSNFVINIDTSAVDLANMIKVNAFDGPWDDGTDLVHYLDLGLGGTAFINLSIKQITAAANPGPNVDTTVIGRVAVPILNCADSSNITWRTGSGAITDWNNVDIKPFATFINPANISLSAIANTTFTFTSDKDTFCAGDTVLFTVLPAFADTFYTYEFYRKNVGPPVTLQSDTMHTLDTAGFLNGDSVAAQVFITTPLAVCFSGLIDTIILTISQPTVNLGPDDTICSGDTVILNAGSGFSGYLWQDGSTDSTFTTDTAGTFYVTVTDAFGCTDSDTIFVTVNPSPIVNLGNDTTICDSLLLDADNIGSTWSWQDASTNQTLTAALGGLNTYWVDVTNAANCTTRDSINVTVNTSPVITDSLGNDTTVCDSIEIGTTISGTYDTYLWNTSDTVRDIFVSVSGTYDLTVSKDGCYGYDTIVVTVIPPLDTPVVTGSALSSVSVQFNWDTIPGATAYEIMIDSNGTWTGWLAPNTPPNAHIVTGLSPSDTVYAIVRAIGPCDTTYSDTAMAVTTT